MRLILVVFVLISINGFSQDLKKIKFSGIVEMIRYHQGGVEIDFQLKKPRPYQTELIVVKYIDSLTIPEVVCSIKTDEKGYFEVELEEGNYGFVLPSEKDHLKPGQVLPTSYYSRTEHTSSSSSWSANVSMPLSISESHAFGFVLTYSNTSSCFTCP